MNLAHLRRELYGTQINPLSKNHLKNVMMSISKLFNGVNPDHQNLQKITRMTRTFGKNLTVRLPQNAD